MSIPPNTELVAMRWLQGLSGLAPAMVSTNIPRDNATWAASGFVQVVGAVGGAMNRERGTETRALPARTR